MSERNTNFPGSSCSTLPPKSIDKYFHGHAFTFERKIGRAICANCPALKHCFTLAIEYPPKTGTQAGLTGPELRRIQAEVTQDNGDLDYEAAFQYMPEPEPLFVRNRNGLLGDEQRQRNAARLSDAE